MAVIVCWRCGTVRVEKARIDGGIVLIKGPRKELERRLEVLARHAYDGQTLLVPGVPEADDDEAALDAVFAFQELLSRSARASAS
jgi:hypothetical protein